MGKTLLLAVILWLLLILEPACGSTWHVDASVAESGDGTSWETAFKAIQTAIGKASNGDTIIVGVGTYVEKIYFPGSNITLRSVDPLDPATVEQTIIDGNQSGAVVTFLGSEDETCVLSGFTIRNGWTDSRDSGICGMKLATHTHATICNNIITDNVGGGVAYCDGAIHNNTIAGNSLGGLGLCNGTIHDNTIRDNSGGGVNSCAGTIRDNTIRGNSGGLRDCDGTIHNNLITENTSALRDCNGLIENNVITGNVASALANCYGTIRHNTITANQAGGGIASGIGGGAFFECNATIEANTISGNSAFDGGAFFHCEDATILNNVISGNSAERSGGAVSWCSGEMLNNVIVGNTVTGYWDDFIGMFDPGSGGGLHMFIGRVRNCIFWANNSSQLDDASDVAYCCVEGGWNIRNYNTWDDPLFVDPDGADDDPATFEDNDYRLLVGSSCIDSGENEDWMWNAVDLDGNPRIAAGDSSWRVDMGPYEHVLSPYKFIISITRLDTTGFRLKWTTQPGDTYTLWSSPDLVAGPWKEEGTWQAVGPSRGWANWYPTAPQTFYRIEIKSAGR
jgi:hypothetical protein